MIKKIRAGVLLLFFLLLSFEACKAGDAEKEAGTKGWKEAADAAENEEQVKKSSSDTTCYTFEDVEGNSYRAELLDEDQYSHSTDPVRKTSPKRNSFRKNLNLCQNR